MIDGKKAHISCLNCQHSYRNREGTLSCFKHHMTTVTHSYDCLDYEVFVDDKEEILRVLNVTVYGVKKK